jgi:hypothetical protein
MYPQLALEPAQRGQDVVTLAALPVFVGAATRTRRGSPRAICLWLGCLGYLLYTYAGAAFAYRWNALFLVYLLLFSGCSFTLARALIELDVQASAFSARAGQPVEGGLTIAYALIAAGAMALTAWFLARCTEISGTR